MAAFIDQFDRHDPQTFTGFGPLRILVSSMADEARSYLFFEHSPVEFKDACRKFEQDSAKEELDPMWRLNKEIGERPIFGHLIFRDGGLRLDSGAFFPGWEAYAVFALWKLIDSCDAMGDSSALSWNTSKTNLVEANKSLALAFKALQLCAVAAIKFAVDASLYVDLVEARSEMARQNVRGRWKTRDAHLTFALELSPSIKEKHRVEVARKLADAIDAKFNKRYGDDIVDGWLKKSGWIQPT